DLDSAPDASTSSMTFRAQPGSPCAGLEKKVPMHGQLVGCWGPIDPGGCRSFQLPFYADCLSVDAVPLGDDCPDPACSEVTTGVLAIGSPGAAGYRVCPPIDSTISCEAPRFRAIQGGLCIAYECDGDLAGANTCQASWGATYWGTQRSDVPPGVYDWLAGTL